MDVRWEFVMPPEPRGVAITEDGARLYIAYRKSLYSLPIEAMSEDEVTVTEFADIQSLATDGKGNALVVDVVDDATELKQIKPDGSVGWTTTFDNSDVSFQPAASTPDGIVYIVVHNTLHQVQDGELRWSYPLKAKTSDIKITVLSDNSVLVAAGTALVHVSNTGEEILTKWLDVTIRTRPIMDENGRVYFGADDGIHCMK
jgi:outer membrane protein assembly factor BamB